MTLNDLVQQSHELACTKGWYEGPPRGIPELLCLIHSEVSEALEEYRNIGNEGLHAIDHACPHEGYGLTQGELDGDLVTCAWHNWKFRVTDGAGVQGEEGVQTHHVEVADNGAVRVSINRPDPAERRPQLAVLDGVHEVEREGAVDEKGGQPVQE